MRTFEEFWLKHRALLHMGQGYDWNEDGTLKKETWYDMGKMLRQKLYEHGKLVSDKKY